MTERPHGDHFKAALPLPQPLLDFLRQSFFGILTLTLMRSCLITFSYSADCLLWIAVRALHRAPSCGTRLRFIAPCGDRIFFSALVDFVARVMRFAGNWILFTSRSSCLHGMRPTGCQYPEYNARNRRRPREKWKLAHSYILENYVRKKP